MFILSVSYSQDSLLTHYLLERIAAQQIKQDNFFIKGIFPSYISNTERFNDHQKDNNIFYTALIDFTLKNIQPKLSSENKLLVDSIVERSAHAFNHFKNKNGRNTYNFWRTDSAFIFPYTKWIRYIKKSAELPDDMDDTVLSLFALSADDSDAQAVHQLMQNFINSDKEKVRINGDAYENFQAYSTWFGKNFPVVFDVCVMCNVLSFVQLHNLLWRKADSASLNFIIAVLKNKDAINNAIKVSPYYGRTSIILYHLARLMSIKQIPELEEMKPALISDAVQIFQSTNNILEKIILSSAIIKLGYNPPPISIAEENNIKDLIEKNDMPFFIGNIPSYLNDSERKFLMMNKLGLFYHYCPAYNDALMLEYLVLKNEK